jgi:hypothetical protein
MVMTERGQPFMQRCLVLQVLGNSDVQGAYRMGDPHEKGSELLGVIGDYSLSGLRDAMDLMEETVGDGSSSINFPLIDRLRSTLGQQLQGDWEIHWAIILTDQIAWMEQQTDRDAEGWKDIVASDGAWWKNLLASWLTQRQIPYTFIPLVVDPQIKDGAADWDGIAEVLAPLLNQFFPGSGKSVHFNPDPSLKPSDSKAFDRVVIQHSSGTPALSSALYLWGIEQKLAGRAFDFAYLSINESNAQAETFSHEGKHWQWRLKKPQVLKLLGLQDFSGALQLLGNDCPDQALVQRLQRLDKAAAFNINALQLDLTPKEDVIERIAIALWTEKALRCNGQWMIWYLRVAGAMELTLLCLVEKQGQNRYEWKPTHLKTILHHPRNPQPHLGFTVGIKAVVKHLLSQGSADQYDDNQKITFTVNRLYAEGKESEPWKKFKAFYYGNQWRLSDQDVDSFLYIRNNLYHSLSGDRLDILLDEQTKVLKSVDHPDHPAFIAIGHLRFLIDLADLTESVKDRMAFYRSEMEQVHHDLEALA